MEASSKKSVPAFRDVIQTPKKVRFFFNFLESSLFVVHLTLMGMFTSWFLQCRVLYVDNICFKISIQQLYRLLF
jgi:hypothetical protein